MTPYTYEQFVEDIKSCRDIEFIYNSNRYSITNTPFGHSFTRYYDEDSVITTQQPDALLSLVKLNGLPLKEAWPDIEIDIIF